MRDPDQFFEAEGAGDYMCESIVGDEDCKVLVLLLGNGAIVAAIFNQLEGDQQFAVFVQAALHLSVWLADFLALLAP